MQFTIALGARLILVSTLLWPVGTGYMAQTCPGAQHPVTNIGERFTSDVKFEAGVREKLKEIPHNGARYLRARIEVNNPGTCEWVLTVRDGDFHVIQTFDQDDFKTAHNRWTNRVPRIQRTVGNSTRTFSKIIFTFAGCEGGAPPEIKFPEYVMMPEKATNPYYSSQVRGRETFKPLYSLSDAEDDTNNKPLGDHVGFLMSSWLNVSWTCSSVFVAKNLILTNWHCGSPGEFTEDGQIVHFPESGYWNAQIVKDTIVDVSFDDDGLSQEYIGTKLVAMDQELDFALLEVAPVDAGMRVRPVAINLEPLTNNSTIKIVHHPEARPKMITLNCRIENAAFHSWKKDVAGIDFTHKCDTEKGSSGAPVFNSRNELIGLHHRGFKVNPVNCHEDERFNTAVRIDKIFEFLQSCFPEVAAKLTLASAPGPPKSCPSPTP